MGMDLITEFMYNHQNFKYFRLEFCLQRVLVTFQVRENYFIRVIIFTPNYFFPRSFLLDDSVSC